MAKSKIGVIEALSAWEMADESSDSCVLAMALQCCDKDSAVVGSSEGGFTPRLDCGQCLPLLAQGQRKGFVSPKNLGAIKISTHLTPFFLS